MGRMTHPQFTHLVADLDPLGVPEKDKIGWMMMDVLSVFSFFPLVCIHLQVQMCKYMFYVETFGQMDR
jgi:hypothetical protein